MYPSCMTRFYEDYVFDFAVYGEGEVTFNELVNTLKAGIVTGETLRAIDGLIFEMVIRQ